MILTGLAVITTAGWFVMNRLPRRACRHARMPDFCYDGLCPNGRINLGEFVLVLVFPITIAMAIMSHVDPDGWLDMGQPLIR